MATDPICGMTVDPQSAAGNHVHNGETYYFCSQHCLAKFKEDPEKFLKSPAAEHAAHGHGHAHAPAAHGDDHSHMHTSSQAAQPEKKDVVYVCPMDPEVRESKPGACPKCGMALEPAAPAGSIGEDGIRLSHASGDRARRAGCLSDLRHGARAAHRDSG